MRFIGFIAAMGLLLPASSVLAASNVSALQSSLLVSSSSVEANYNASTIVSVYVRDTNGFALPGKKVQLSSPQIAIFPQPFEVFSNAQGLAQFNLKSSQVGNATIRATADDVLINQTQNVSFFYAGPAVSALQSQVTVTKNVASSNGVDQIIGTATIRDAYGNPLSNKGVAFFIKYQSSGGLTLIETTTDANGKSTFAATSAITDTQTITTKAGGVDLNTVVLQFGSSNVSGAKSSFDASPSSIIANGTNYVYITAVVRDTNGNPLPNKTISVSTLLNGQTTTQQFVTDNQGKATYAIQPYTIGTAYLTASADGVIFGQTTLQYLSPQNDQTVSMYQSSVLASPSVITLDGTSVISLDVYARSQGGQTVAGKPIQILSNNIGFVIDPPMANTNSSGNAHFTLRPLQTGTTNLMIKVDVVLLAQQPIITVNGLSCAYVPGTLFKLPNDGDPNTQADSAVYYYGRDCKRHAFPNAQAYFTWFENFSNIQIWNANVVASIALGKNVTYRPGAKMIRFATINKNYMVSKGGILRWISSDNLAQQFWGADWANKIETVPDAFFTNYTVGPDLWYTWDYNIGNEYTAADINA